ncbi:ornithine cyclodeaminase family protein [Ferroacidibacillus organovorans]|uniref:Ornithine cyclodeaminase n=1 Tax=Ferroacidibacillus organovorans TaxID=1765683 RepID=A0A853K9V4_9BACL|nr:ornithine cyclodeaminase family protein [Ferroacidibacillus organovorans]KYP81161.1 hypothetical protein AYJ22_08375 [Ferroacidibacillus organovorans]OAG93825.1 hypothetical protein AYW79_08525 [Ferroacidibacillus organovorans]
MYSILTDHDVESFASMKRIVNAIERCFQEQINGTLVSPPRFRVEAEQGNLVFTAGAATGLEKVTGFRVYDTYENDAEGHQQLVCVFDSDTGVFKGVVIGNLIGAIRTGAIGGAAINAMARVDAKKIAVMGTGLQARTQLEAAVAVRNIKSIKVYSRKQENREAFAEGMRKKIHANIAVATSPRDCIEDADIVICATNSGTPVFESDWLKPGTHINTVGPKTKNWHEVPLDLGIKSTIIATDSIEQLHAYKTPHFLVDTKCENRIVQLSEIVCGKASGRMTETDITLFCSVGLAGTEVVVANEIMKIASRTKKASDS